MADLSNLLGDVYGEPEPDTSATPKPPAWADDQRLDAAFANWTPAPLEPAVAKVPSSAPLDDDLAAALSAALADAPRPSPVAPPVARFAHVDAVEPVEPAVVDAATLEPIADPVDALLDAVIIEPPTPVAEPKRRGLSLSRRSRPHAVAPVPAPIADGDPIAPPVAAATWHRTDDDILPARSGGGRGSGLRLR